MRLATFLLPGSSEPLAGEVRDERVVAFSAHPAPDGVRERLASGDRTPASGPDYALAEVTLLAPVPQPRAIFGIGLNYAAHAAEGGKAAPSQPIVFFKQPGASVAPSGPVRHPAVTSMLDYEAELAVVIGADGQIGGFAVADDVSARDLQRSEPQWVRAKGGDTFCPWGPWITTADELSVSEAEDLQIRAWVNGELRQDSRTSDLIFGCQACVDFIAESIALQPGDLILTGTPSGVGVHMRPSRFLTPGDVVRIELERLGAIEHPVV
ncbi:fumarylacetoacetate hydrolase family protein [Conexibacter sp. CPCC 206217]|uniref:fumarylacetoacetate hydrolase family protein n=1 Tax=Conexibacter sp. CPCC 206217 TaxID=3064574 RepID=UPI0027272BE4|nr:fumarylacetoacetate hydrolase family protein [Conexibacter sp. CPCC 206217]MDO8209912.1 fumarylacetoacetate hydrolase family protein [Conexibacter sp. CPCC 206217]